MNLLLISIHIEDSIRAVPLGPAMLASAVNRHFGERIDASVVNFYLEQSVEECVKSIIDSGAGYVGFSMFVWNRNRVLEIVESLKSLKSETVLFAGGPEATAAYDDLIELPCFDFIVKGEGEEILVNVFEYFLQDEKMEKVKELAALPLAPDLDRLPSPFLDGTLDPDDYSGLLWELSRGCPFKCDFCFESRGTAGIRRFSIDRIKRELELFKERNVEEVFVLDPTFNYNRETAKEILRLIIEMDTGIHFSFEVRSEFLDEEMAELFSKVSCSLQIGLQSSDVAVLESINRKMDPADFKEKVLLLHQNQVVYGFDLIYGLPLDTLEGFRRSLDYALGMVPNHIDIFPLSILPGTRLHETAPTFDMKYLKDNPYTVISTPTFSEADMSRAAELAASCETFYNEGKAVPWFSIILETLEMLPSEFLSEFCRWNKEQTQISENVFERQRRFLIYIFESKMSNSELGEIASDIAAYFGYTALLMENENELPLDIGEDCLYVLNPDSCFVKLTHDPVALEELMYSGITNINDLPSVLQEVENEVLFFMNENQLDLRFLTDSQKKLLKSLENGLSEVPENGDLREFFFSCIEDNIVWQR